MSGAPPTTSAVLDDMAADLAAVRQLLSAAVSAQYLPSLKPGRSASGSVPDPTAELALDEGRLALRASVQLSTTRLIMAAQYLRLAREEVDNGLAAWEGPVDKRR